MRSFVLLVLVGCSTTRNPERCLDGLCADPELPFCDSTGSISGEPNTCVAVACTPNDFQECRGDRALTCNGAGDNYELLQCEYGCGPTGCIPCDTPDCEKRIVPKYVPASCEALASKQKLDITENTTLDTGGDACTAVVPQVSGPDLCVIKYQQIGIRANQTLKVRGTRALALVADYAFDLEGTLDVSADSTTNGPGVTLVSGSASATVGGGGAGYRTAGAPGGTTLTGGAANGGPPGASPLVVSQLLAGRTAAIELNTLASGGGGGAATIVSCRGKLSVSGTIDAGGGGGRSGYDDPGIDGRYYPPTGGGSGGTVVLQGFNVAVTGRLFANGGGGGGGGNSVLIVSGEMISMPGQDGQASVAVAIGGAGYTGGGGGAKGGFGASTGGPGSGGASATWPGAGGGSSGYFVIYTPEANVPTVAPTAVSPTIEPRQIVPTN